MTQKNDLLIEGIEQVSIEKEMRQSYLDYAMSVIVSRALPDVRDGLKPVHRRILYAMKEAGYDFNKPTRKSANVVGRVMGLYHPHGDAAIYDAMVRMVQDFSMRLPLVNGQGNFGSMDGDPAAAMRYTEARLAKSATALLADIDRETVDFVPNYDETTQEPTVLPAQFPNILVNGAGGIAVGMATNIPPHNLGEVIDACCAYIDNPDISLDELMTYVQGPDFPTGGVILGRSGILSAYTTGRGSVVMRGKVQRELVGKDRDALIVTEIPYQVNKARMMERMAEVVHDKIIEGISDLRDESSNREGVRVVIEIKRGFDADVILNQLYRHTPLQTSFGVQLLALSGGRPKLFSLKDVFVDFVLFREQVITRRVRFDLRKAQERAHILLGLAIAVAHIDEVIQLIKSAPDPYAARVALMARAWARETIGPLLTLVRDPHETSSDGPYHLSEEQARAILDLRLHRLTGLERDKIDDELKEVAQKIHEYMEILSSRTRLLEIMRDELLAVKAEFGTPRRTHIEDGEFNEDMESLIQREEMVITVSHNGYIKRVPLSTYRAQRRGGRGKTGMKTREEDVVSDLFIADTLTPLLFFSTHGRVYQLKVYKLPLGSAQALGKAMVNLLPLEEGEKISTVLPLRQNEEEGVEATPQQILFVTSSGSVRRNALADFLNIRANGKIAMRLEGDEHLVSVKLCSEDQDIFLTTRSGRCIRFPVTDIRVFVGRDSTGVRGIRLAPGDAVISMSLLNHADFTAEERDLFLRQSARERRLAAEMAGELAGEEGLDAVVSEMVDEEEASTPSDTNAVLSPERYAEMLLKEQFILSVTAGGMGKRTSHYEYRLTHRGGTGILNMALKAQDHIVASFPVGLEDEMILMTDGGQIMRCSVAEVRIVGRHTQGVRLIRMGAGEAVVSVAAVMEEQAPEGADEMVGETSIAGVGIVEASAVIASGDSFEVGPEFLGDEPA